ncbi:MAG: hypothetical protein CM1200mP9_00830 [Gammaproteobacteria bacterium]|nr:MAG: hypothetical protein CM1200mP9_00830 [Gammaproteobacteria bacterium]
MAVWESNYGRRDEGDADVPNVWLIIWPNQKIVIASNEAVAPGGEADPGQADAAATRCLRQEPIRSFPPNAVFYGIEFPFSAGTGIAR